MVYTISTGPVLVIRSESKLAIWKEVFLAFIVNLPFITHGIETTLLTSSVHSGHFITYEDVQWTTTAMVIATAVASPVFCYIIDKFGRITGIFMISMLQGISLVPHFLLNQKNVYNVQIILHILVGISSGGLFNVIPIYVREIATARGFCLSFMMAMVTGGYMLKFAAVEVRLYLMLVLVVVQFFSMIVLVESPPYLVMVKKYEKSRKNISKLKLLAANDVNVSKEISRLKDESDRAQSNGNLSLPNLWRNKIWLDATKIGIVLFTISVLCGSILFLDQEKTLMQLKVTPDPDSTLVLSALFGGSVFCVLGVAVMDKKYLLTLGYVVMTLSTGVLAVYTQTNLTVTSLRWLPVVSLGVLVFAYGVVWGLPIVIMVEVFNIEIRAPLLGSIFMYSEIIKLAHVHTFQYIEEYVGIYTTFYLFASVNLFGVVYTLFIVPNTNNKSVKQIEKQLKRPSLPA